MKIEELDQRLAEDLEFFGEQVKFDLETFSQNRTSPYLTKDDMEEVFRQTFYLLYGFKKNIIKYLKSQK